MNFICSSCAGGACRHCANVFKPDGSKRKYPTSTHCDCQHRDRKPIGQQ